MTGIAVHMMIAGHASTLWMWGGGAGSLLKFWLPVSIGPWPFLAVYDVK